MLNSWYLTLKAFTPPNLPLAFVAKYLSQINIQIFSRRQLACLCGQLQITVELEGVNFGTRMCFLVGTLSVYGDIKTHFTVDCDTDIPAVYISWQPWCFLVILSQCFVWQYCIETGAPNMSILSNTLKYSGNRISKSSYLMHHHPEIMLV